MEEIDRLRAEYATALEQAADALERAAQALHELNTALNKETPG